MKKLLALLLCFRANGFAQTPLSIERIFSSPALDGKAPRSTSISPDGQRVTFLRSKQDNYFSHWLVMPYIIVWVLNTIRLQLNDY